MCGDQPTPDGIANNEHDNRNRLGCVPGCQRRGRGIRSDDINLQANQLRCEVGEPIEVSRGSRKWPASFVAGRNPSNVDRSWRSRGDKERVQVFSVQE